MHQPKEPMKLYLPDDDDDLELFMPRGVWFVYACIMEAYGDAKYNSYSCLCGDECFMVPYIVPMSDEEFGGCNDYHIVHEYLTL